MIDEIHASGRLVGGLRGKVKQGSGTKRPGGGHPSSPRAARAAGRCGEIGSMVLLAADGRCTRTHAGAGRGGGVGNGRQAAGGLALGRAGATAPPWLTVTEADNEPAQKKDLLRATSEDTVRSRAWTGKPCRMVKNDWTQAWEQAGNPKPLGMPLQGRSVLTRSVAPIAMRGRPIHRKCCSTPAAR